MLCSLYHIGRGRITFFTFCWQTSAKAQAAQTYRNKLNKAGLEEHFVEEKGEAAEGSTS